MFFESKKMIEELEAKNSKLKEEEEERLRGEISKLKKQLSGEHVTSVYCHDCSHVIRDCVSIACELECKCKDFRSVREV